MINNNETISNAIRKSLFCSINNAKTNIAHNDIDFIVRVYLDRYDNERAGQFLAVWHP